MHKVTERSRPSMDAIILYTYSGPCANGNGVYCITHQSDIKRKSANSVQITDNIPRWRTDPEDGKYFVKNTNNRGCTKMSRKNAN